MAKTHDIHNLIVFVEGGVVVSVYSDALVEISICDLDATTTSEQHDEYVKGLESKKDHMIRVY
jgi:hypothetical protein